MREGSSAQTVRRILRAAPRASLATLMREGGGAPYASLVLVATDHDGSPILLLSDLADHSQNLWADERASLLLDDTGEREDPLAGERVTLQGRLRRSALARLRERYLARHPAARTYAEFQDFSIYSFAVERAHLVAGFGRIHWLDAAQILIAPQPALIEHEGAILEHMNDEHRDAIELYAHRLLHLEGEGWRMTGVDPEGCDLRLGPRVARLTFEHMVVDAGGVRAELVRLVKRARDAAAPSCPAGTSAAR